MSEGTGTSTGNGLDTEGQELDYQHNATGGELRNPAYDLSYAPSGSAYLFPSAQAQQPRPPKPVKSRLGDIYAIGRLLEIAAEQLEAMEQLVTAEEEAMDIANAGYEVEDTLADLWELRQARESNFAGLLNILQGCLAREIFETWSASKCIAVRSIVTEILSASDIDYELVKRAMLQLKSVGLDPWKGISGDVSEGA